MANKLTIHGNLNPEFSLSFMVVSSETKESTKLVNALLAQQQRQRLQYQLFAHSCNNLHEVILRNNTKIHVDYCVFLIRSHKISLEEINENLKYLDEVFFVCRFCFIVISNGPYQVTATNVKHLRDTYKCHILVIDESGFVNQDKWLTLAERVVNLAVAACGLKSGILKIKSLASELAGTLRYVLGRH